MLFGCRSRLDPANAQIVLSRLLHWLVRLTNQGDGAMVGKKLCSAITAYYIQSTAPWEQPLRHIALCFRHGEAVSPDALQTDNTPFSVLLASLSHPQITTVLWLAASLAEEMGRVDSNTAQTARIHAQMENIVRDASETMHRALQLQTSTPELATEALVTFQQWVDYAQPVWPRNPDALQYLRNLIAPAAACLSSTTVSQEALDVFRDILESYTSFFRYEHIAMLAEIIYQYINPPLQRALQEQDSDGQHVLYGQFVIAFGCANIQQVVEDPQNQLGSINLVTLHTQMISTPGYPGDDDQLSVQAIEFWNTYVEHVNDIIGSGDEGDNPPWQPAAQMTLQRVFECLCRKITTPPPDVAEEWGDDEHEGFKEFRLDATDLLLSIYIFLEKPMLEELVGLICRSLQAKEWRVLEAALFILNRLADNVLEEPGNGSVLEKVFQTTLFREVANFSLDIPSQTRRAAIDLLGSYGQYIERHAEFLPDTLNFLFASLETTTLAAAAARSIDSLCSTCRAELTNELPGFVAQYQRFLKSDGNDPYTKKMVIGAIASIIQAMRPESAKAEPLIALIEQVERDVEAAKKFAAAGEAEQEEEVGVNALECLASIGRGMQVPDDVPIDLYSEESGDAAATDKSTYWQSADGQAIQRRIMGCFSVLQVVGGYSAAIDAACQVLKSGYTETEPGPFVLPPSVTVSFVQQCSLTTPQLEMVLSTACLLVTQHSHAPKAPRIESEVRAIYACVLNFMTALRDSTHDPAVANACIEIVGRMMPYYTHVLFPTDSAPNNPTATMLNFVLTAVIGPDQFPKRAACDFWTKLIKPQTAALTPQTRQSLEAAIEAYGAQLTECIIVEIGGRGRRSELDVVCNPLLALLLHRGETRRWLERALGSESFPDTQGRATDEEKGRFLRGVVAAGSDGRKVREVVRVFWALCRGTVVGFGS
ncbi:armadillo-type protein [Neohortaea acidophila]|uniref:Armadillo-type protein n=1 Tax=Neohortaea acidophila TaxID=245834 RepID=A0A6A6PZP5_9PEZI|nr:armadillo-type protein [Neohortaea acidophila]KAF2484647.1 armadillo-type protein [Neohortaea acidophila]